MLRSGDFGTAVMRLLGAHMTRTSSPACSFSPVTYITWSRGTLNVYNKKSRGCHYVIVLNHARESCVLGRRKSFVRKQVTMFLFFKTENWCAARLVVNPNAYVTLGTQEEEKYHQTPEAGSTLLLSQNGELVYSKVGCQPETSQ